MFVNFSFDAPSRQSSSASYSDPGSVASSPTDSSRSVSPCSSTSSFHPPRLSVTELSEQFAQQRIRNREAQICVIEEQEEDPRWQPDLGIDGDFTPPTRSRTFPQRPHSPSRRIQRQVNTRLLCTASHHRDIAALVARMVNSGEQCEVSPPDSITPPNGDDEDEGYNSSEDSQDGRSRRPSIAASRPRLSYRRSGELAGSGACVSKDVRFRKDRKRPRRSVTDQR